MIGKRDKNCTEKQEWCLRSARIVTHNIDVQKQEMFFDIAHNYTWCHGDEQLIVMLLSI